MTRAEAIDAIVKTLEMADNTELSDAYMYIVDCNVPGCPIHDECRTEFRACRCDNVVMKKLEEEDKENENNGNA